MTKGIEQILKEAKTIAVVGLSPNPERDSHRVAKYLQAQGYRILPVNPNVEQVLGEKSYPDLEAIPEKIDIVDIFRRSEEVLAIVDQAIPRRTPTVWMQLGIINQAAASKAKDAGLNVVMDKCLMVEHRRLIKGDS